MEQIVITRADSTTWSLITKGSISAITKAEQRRSLMGEDTVTMTVESAILLEFNLRDSITVYGRTYVLNTLPRIQKNSNRDFTYYITWEARLYDLLKALYLDEDTDGLSISPDFSLTGNLEMFINVLLQNLARVYGGGKWLLGDCPVTDYLTLTFSNENCLRVLQRLCKEDCFNKEFEITENSGVCTINIKDAVGQNISQTFRYGKGLGLYELTRDTVSEKNIITVLYAFGSDKNLGSDYRGFSQRLKLPGNDLSYIINNTARIAYGKIEGVKIFDNIFPHRTGTVTSEGASVLQFIDSGMDFDLNSYLVSGVTPKIHFNTGNLAGYEFEITAYNHTTKTFSIKSFTDERSQVFPDAENTAFQIGEADKYVILDITLPATYIQAAESELHTAAQDYLAQNSQPRVQYSLKIDQLFLKKLYPGSTIVNVFEPGDYLPVEDDDIGVNSLIRILSYRRDLFEHYNYDLTLSNIVERPIFERLLSSNIEIAKLITLNKLNDVARARRSWKSTRELLDMIFDQDDYFDAEKIKPGSIETNMLSVGSRSAQLTLTCRVEPNYTGDATKVYISSGSLSHYAIDETIKDWAITGGLVTLENSGAYYIYAKCSKSDTSGVLLFSQSQIKVNDDANHYHFLLGLLGSIDTGIRWISLTYGATAINGRFIRTGRIISQDGNTYFDLDTGEIGGVIKFAATSSGYSNISDKPDLSIFAEQSYVEAMESSLQSQIDGQVISWFKEYDPTTLNLPASEWTTDALKQQHANDTFTNTLTGGCWRWQQSAGIWGWGVIADTATQQALTAAGIAQDTADGKRRVFVAQPTTPYDVGDLWSAGPAGDLKKCITSRSTGAYNAADWENAAKYTDDTAANAAQSTANNAASAASEAQIAANSAHSITDNFTTIEGGVLTGSIVQVGNSVDGVVAGFAGIEAGVDKVRLWMGSSYADRNNAPLRFYQDGTAVLTKLIISCVPQVFDSISQSLSMIGSQIFETSNENDTGAIRINVVGYQGGTDYYRNTIIGDGRLAKLLVVEGKYDDDHSCIFLGNDGELYGLPSIIDMDGAVALKFGNRHSQVTGTSDINAPASESDMTNMSITITPKGRNLLILFSAPIAVISAGWLAGIFVITVDGTTVKTHNVQLYDGVNSVSFHHLLAVTPETEYVIKIRWSGTNTNMRQRGSTDSPRVMTIIDTY